MFWPSGVWIGTEAAVVRWVHVAHFEACALAGEAAGAERRERAHVFELVERRSAGA